MAFFATTRNQPDTRPMRRVYDGPLTKLSHDNVLNMGDLQMPSAASEVMIHRPMPQSNLSYHAGAKVNRSASVRSVLTGSDTDPFSNAVLPPKEPRHQYQHPTYAVSRSNNGNTTKELLYGAPTPPVAPPPGAVPPPPPADHPLEFAYNTLVQIVPTLPKDNDGSLLEDGMRAALDYVKVELSLDGLAELLARCDVSPTGFPPFDDFLMCASRPERAAPAEHMMMGGAEAIPASMHGGGVADYTGASSAQLPPGSAAMPPPAMPPPDHQPPAPQQAPSAEAAAAALQQGKNVVMPERTWRGMQMEEAMTQGSLGTLPVGAHHAQGAPAPVLAPPEIRSSFPLGMRSRNVLPIGMNVAPMYAKNLRGQGHASSQKFTNSFNPDFFVL